MSSTDAKGIPHVYAGLSPITLYALAGAQEHVESLPCEPVDIAPAALDADMKASGAFRDTSASSASYSHYCFGEDDVLDIASDNAELTAGTVEFVPVDFSVRDHGSIVLLYPETQAGEDWAQAHLPDDAMRWAAAVCVEPRFMQDILDGIRADGLVVA